MSQLDFEPIAIVGSGCRFPGAGNSTSRLWDQLCHPVDLLHRIPPERFNSGNFYHPDPLHHGTANIKHSYVLEDDVRKFDARRGECHGPSADDTS
jgi:hybrid polyketide synthase/nonribosomal peptide synthetase ACE1